MGTKRASTLQKELKQGKAFRSLAQEATIAVLRTADVLRNRVSEVTDAYGITMQQYNVLRILRGSHPDPLPTLEIAERMIERQPGITRLLDRLESKDLVRRVRCESDRRMMHCWITDAGLELLASMDAPIDEVDESCVHGLSETEQRLLIDFLARLRAEP